MTDHRALSYPFAAPPGDAALIEVAPGVHWLRMPIPLDLDHINLWLIEDSDADGAPAWTIVDSGFGTDAVRDLWRAIFDGPAAGRRPHRLICTHYHPDHFGLAGWLARAYGVTVEMTEGEWVIGALLPRMAHETFAAGQDRFFARHGMDAARRARLAEGGNEFAHRVAEPPEAFTRIRDGEVLAIGGRSWQVLVTEGHAPEHACLYCAELGVLICGDQVLPKITPNVSVHWFKTGSRPLADYLASLDVLAPLPADTLVLPSHKLPYHGLPARLDQLRAHHAERLGALADALDPETPLSAAELMPAMFNRELDDMHMMFALGETVAHLEHLVDEGRARFSETDGIARYRRAA